MFPVNVVLPVAPAGTTIVIGDDGKVAFVTLAKVETHVMLY